MAPGWWGFRKTRTNNLGGTSHDGDNNSGVPAKLSNEAVKCRNYDASRQTDHNI